MQLFLDSADTHEIKFWLGQGVLDGVTTNPSVLARDGVVDVAAALRSLVSLVSPGILHAEVTQECGQALVDEATALHALGENVVAETRNRG